MKKYRFEIVFVSLLISLSVALYFIHYLLFHDAKHIFIYLIGDIAFMPIEVLIVTLIFHRVLQMREKRLMMKKLNMVIGTFFSEVGTELLKAFTDSDGAVGPLRDMILENRVWSERGVMKISREIQKYQEGIKSSDCNLVSLRAFLHERRDFLLRLLENPNLLEHESFTELLWAVFHMEEELQQRTEFTGLPESDYHHITGDIRRVYKGLLVEWVRYMKHLKDEYPYLFSLAMRTNPFDTNASIIVR